MSNDFYGDVAYLDRPTTDGRRLAFNAPAPLRSGARVFIQKDGATEQIGEILLLVAIAGTIRVSGTVDLPPGDYPCGVTLDSVEVQVDPDRIEALLGGEDELVFTAGRVAAVTVYADGSEPAWPGTHITVTEGSTTR